MPSDITEDLSRAEEIAHALNRGEIKWFAATDQLRSYYVSEGQHHQALRASLALLQEFPYLPLPYAYAGDALVALGRLNEAAEYYGAANDLEESAKLHFNLGLIYQRIKQLKLAGEHFERAVSMDPIIPEFQLQLARHYILTRDLPKASKAVEALLALDPAHDIGLTLKRLLEASYE